MYKYFFKNLINYLSELILNMKVSHAECRHTFTSYLLYRFTNLENNIVLKTIQVF